MAVSPTNIARQLVVLAADDDGDDAFFLADALGEVGLDCDLRQVPDGEALIDYLTRSGQYEGNGAAPIPDLVMLDLNMPRKDGREALREIRADSRLRHLPVIILSTSDDSVDINECYALGANSYFVKPHEHQRWVDLMRAVTDYWFAFARRPMV